MRTVSLLLLLASGLLGITARAESTTAYAIGDVPNVHVADRRQYVSDPTAILSAAARDSINVLCQQLEAEKGVQVAVVMLPSIEGGDIFEFAHGLFRQWGIGEKKSNNGLLVLFVSDLRQVRFTTGYGLEGTLPDAICKRVQSRCMVPRFREGDYDGGMVEGLKALAAVIRGDSSLAREAKGKIDGSDDDTAMLLFVVLAIIAMSLLPTFLARRRYHCSRCGQKKARRTAMRRQVENGRVVRIETYRCEHCGHTFERRHYDGNPDDGSSAANGLSDLLFFGSILGGMRGRSGGGGGFGGSFGGGSTGGGGSTSGW